MSKHFTYKYLFMLLLSAMLSGPVVGQNAPRNKKKDKTELPADDTARTLTHSMPVPGVEKTAPHKRKKFLVGHVDDSYELGVGSFVNTTQNDTRAILVPSITAKPFVRFFDKYTIGVYANAIVQNYAGTNFSPVVNEMYLDASTQTKIGKFDIRIGKMAAINYPFGGMESLPFGNFMLHRFYMDSRRYLPRAIIGTYSTPEMTFGIGYGEFGDGFAFDGVGYAIMVIKQKIGDDFEIGGFLLHNYQQSCGDIYVSYQPTRRDMILVQLLDTGEKSILYGAYRHVLKSNDAAIAINGFVQPNDGMAGADITFQHIKSGTYISTGAHHHDPLMNNQEPEQWIPFIQIGINKTLLPKKSR